MNNNKTSLPPEWWRHSVFYQIYPLSFQDTTGNGRGDLQGIISHLDYLSGSEDSLGIDAVWLNPINPSPKFDHGYDVSDYYQIDPELGDLETFEELIQETQKRGIKIIMDYVINHTSHLHLWFQESRQSRDNNKSDWYIWRDPASDGGPPNNWLSVFGGSSWTYVPERDQYYMHSFLPEQPDLNWRNPDTAQEMKKVLEFWLERGVGGFRVDAIDHIFKDPEFRNEPANPNYNPQTDHPYDSLRHIYSRNQWTELKELLRDLSDNVLGKKQQHFMITETWLDPDQLLEFHRISGYRQHLPFNFHFLHLPWQADEYRNFINHYDGLLGMEHCPNFVYGNHDNLRVAGRLGTERAGSAAIMLLTLRGMPFIYYGDELGMKNTPIPQEWIQDPWEKRVPGFGLDRDPARTPMPWSPDKNAGFSDNDPWLPLNPDYQTVNVESQNQDPRSFLSLYKNLLALRRNSTALQEGYYHAPDIENSEEVFAYIRESGSQKLLIIINFSDKKIDTGIELTTKDLKLSPAENVDSRARLLLSSGLNYDSGKEFDLEQITLDANEGLVLDLREKTGDQKHRTLD